MHFFSIFLGFDDVSFGSCDAVCGKRPRQLRCSRNDCISNDIAYAINTFLNLQNDQDCCTGKLNISIVHQKFLLQTDYTWF